MNSMMMYSVTLVLPMLLVGVVQAQEFIPVVSDQCFEPMSPGFCRAYFPAFFYNPLTETCECFIFGGCAPNGNNFASLEECMGTCNVRPQLQTISQTCIDIFGADDPALIVAPRPISPRPIVFSSLDSLPEYNKEPAVSDKAASTTIVPKVTSTSTTIATTTYQVTKSTTTASSTTAAPTTVDSKTAASKTTTTTTTTSTDFPTTSSQSSETSTTEAPTTADSTTPVLSSPSVPVVNASTIFTTTNLQTLKTIIQRLLETLSSQ